MVQPLHKGVASQADTVATVGIDGDHAMLTESALAGLFLSDRGLSLDVFEYSPGGTRRLFHDGDVAIGGKYLDVVTRLDTHLLALLNR